MSAVDPRPLRLIGAGEAPETTPDVVRDSARPVTPAAAPTLRMTATGTGIATSGTPAAVRRELVVVNSLMAAHPDLPPFGATDYADVPGRGSVVMIHLSNSMDVLKWARVLGAVAHDSGRSHYGRTAPEPTSGTLHDWMWWRVVYADSTAVGVPVRLWNLETSGHDRITELALAGWVRGGDER
ncbi:hypothetical protein [Streptomyces microflavus]|uniref:hypothetical protein n=1 Tax=Streptomyces microflavus TaxID=1919 RepID=UPI0037F81B57